MVAIATILISGATGVAIPLVCRRWVRCRPRPPAPAAYSCSPRCSRRGCSPGHGIHAHAARCRQGAHIPLPPDRALVPIPVPRVRRHGRHARDAHRRLRQHAYEQKHHSEEEQAAAANGSPREEITAALLEDGALAVRGDVDGRDGGGQQGGHAMHIVARTLCPWGGPRQRLRVPAAAAGAGSGG